MTKSSVKRKTILFVITCATVDQTLLNYAPMSLVALYTVNCINVAPHKICSTNVCTSSFPIRFGTPRDSSHTMGVAWEVVVYVCVCVAASYRGVFPIPYEQFWLLRC